MAGRPPPEPARRNRFRAAAVIGMTAPTLLALTLRGVDIGVLVGWAFALAASTFCPLFVLGIWWPRLTSRAAAVGMIASGVVASGAIVAGLVVGTQTSGGTISQLLAQPAVVSVPVSFASMIVVSLISDRPPDVAAQMLTLHAPEGLGLEALERARA